MRGRVRRALAVRYSLEGLIRRSIEAYERELGFHTFDGFRPPQSVTLAAFVAREPIAVTYCDSEA
jgi:hypothetical protein